MHKNYNVFFLLKFVKDYLFFISFLFGILMAVGNLFLKFFFRLPNLFCFLSLFLLHCVILCGVYITVSFCCHGLHVFFVFCVCFFCICYFAWCIYNCILLLPWSTHFFFFFFFFCCFFFFVFFCCLGLLSFFFLFFSVVVFLLITKPPTNELNYTSKTHLDCDLNKYNKWFCISNYNVVFVFNLKIINFEEK